MPVIVAYASKHGSAQGIASELRRTRPPHAPRGAGRDRPRPLLEGL
jgi:hypothetical protein